MNVRLYRFAHNERTVTIRAASEKEAKEAFLHLYNYWPQESISSVKPQSTTETNYDDYSWSPYV